MPRSALAYATQFPSGENAALVGFDEWTAPNGVGLPSRSEKVHNETSDPFVTLNRNESPFGDQLSGACVSPAAGMVRRSAAPPSAGCQKMARSPSRSD